ncbi:MAG: hypothetical protein QOD49_2544 [Actinomycetota bacterium]|nr:hypothetical protein [Actinomycetota bacterium]
MDELETRVVGVRRRLHLAGLTALASGVHTASASTWAALSRPACTDGHQRQLHAAGRGDRGPLRTYSVIGTVVGGYRGPLTEAGDSACR